MDAVTWTKVTWRDRLRVWMNRGTDQLAWLYEIGFEKARPTPALSLDSKTEMEILRDKTYIADITWRKV
jgi:hypothetical protein